MNKYGVFPDFKAGIHIGEVTTGEIGALKKEIFFVGDVLNTSARIQGMCKQYDADLIISNDLYTQLDKNLIDVNQLGDIVLKGKAHPTSVFSVQVPS